jgi:hypothetical protein
MPIPDKKKSSYQQDLERRSNDLLRVYNPTNERYVVEWDRKNGTKLFPIESKTEEVFIRYIAEKYIREMFDKIIIEDADKAVRKENQRRIKAGMAEMDKTLKTGEQEQFESKFYVGNDQRAKEIVALLYVGLETEFGVDRVYEQEEKDERPVFEKAMETVQEEKDTGVTPTVQPQTQLKCNWPDCGFEATNKAGLMSHKRSHRTKELEEKKKEVVKEVSK